MADRSTRHAGPASKALGPLAASVAIVDRLHHALAADDRAKIVVGIRALATRRAPLGAQWQQLAQIASDYGELSLGRRAMELYVEAAGGTALARYQQAGVLAQGGALNEAYALLCALPEDQPDLAINAYSRGAAALALGRLGEARDMLEHAARLRPGLGQVWLPLATVVDFSAEPEMAELMLAAGPGLETAPPAVRATYCYALGKAYADLGENALAFTTVARGAALKKADARYDRAQDAASAAEAVRGYDATALEIFPFDPNEADERSIFVTGLPRSGTTLVQQILTGHSAVTDGGEINRLRMLAREIGGPSFAPLERYFAARGTGPAVRLWRHWLDERFPAPGRIVDKSMDSSRFLGLAAALLPDAPLIWLRRDPLDCAWSCFRTHFLSGVAWSYDLEDIAFHFRFEDELLERWQHILGPRLLTVPYEALVAAPEAWIRRILAHCGLAEESGAFAPHRNAAPATTSSVAQVREPINRRGIGSAGPYRRYLEPFEQAYFAPA